MPQTAPVIELRSGQLAKWGAAIVASLAVIGTLANLVIYQVAFEPDVPLGRLARRFDLGHEPSIPNWYSSFALLACAILLALLAVVERSVSRRHAIAWGGLAAIFVLLSIDEAVMFHEMFINSLRSAWGTHGIFSVGHPWHSFHRGRCHRLPAFPLEASSCHAPGNYCGRGHLCGWGARDGNGCGGDRGKIRHRIVGPHDCPDDGRVSRDDRHRRVCL
jgi:hypothetical protein